MQKTSFTKPLQAFIKKYGQRIDSALENIHPRVINYEYLSQITGEPRYANLAPVLTKAISDPNFALLDRPRSRIRPILFLLTLGGLGTNPDEFIDLSTICELFHNGTLIHDDIEDCAEARRGKPPIHNIYGVDIAINSANFMYFLPLVLIGNDLNRLGMEKTLQIYQTIVRQMINVTFGQALDIFWHKNDLSIDENEYYQMAAYKTGGVDRYSLIMAGVIAGVERSILDEIDSYAQMVGIAFQVHDDVFDLIAYDRQSFGGKPIGNDITEGKKSLVIVRALNVLPAQKANRLIEILKLGTRDTQLIREAINLANDSGAIEYAVNKGVVFFESLSEKTELIYPNQPYSTMLADFWHYMASHLHQEYVNFTQRVNGA
jgi:geranylgeranyl pyrophosphate synthase